MAEWTEGQELALAQLRAIEQTNPDALFIAALTPPAETDSIGTATISIATNDLPLGVGGIPLRRRERLRVCIPADFPFKPPSLFARHKRYASYPHVFWGNSLCLYQAPATEWDPRSGMYGFIERVELWFRKAAVAQLDPPGAPLHPPTTTAIRFDLPGFVVNVDTPRPGTGNPWLGFAALEVVSPDRVNVTGWQSINDGVPPTPFAPALLLAEETPHQYPSSVEDIVRLVEQCGIRRDRLYDLLKIASLANEDDTPIYVVLGAPMRGIVGKARFQHLTIWHIPPTCAKTLRLSIGTAQDDEQVTDLRAEIMGIFEEWVSKAQVDWCWTLEGRPEVTVRRDESATAAVFRGMTVSLWGCGALGTHVGECLVRAGVQRIILRDSSIVRPGVAVRQLFEDGDLCKGKASSLAAHLSRITPGVDVVPHFADVLKEPLGTTDWTDGVELIIDATASAQVWSKLERVRRLSKHRVGVASLMVDHRAECLFVAVSSGEHTGGTFDVMRKMQIELCSGVGTQHFADSFWPRDLPAPFQPEPGCSEPTFVGSEADSMAHVGNAMNFLASRLADKDVEPTAQAYVSRRPSVGNAPPGRITRQVSLHPDIVVSAEGSTWEVRISQSAHREILAWKQANDRTRGSGIETGGVLLGQFDESSGILWISSALGPPPDSQHGTAEYVSGIAGIAEAHEEARARTRGAVGYVGIWHTHPGGSPRPSDVDLSSMITHVANHIPHIRRSAMIIVGEDSGTLSAGAYVFSNRSIDSHHAEVEMSSAAVAVRFEPSSPRNVGLALSGGGARAIAFHMGCLRALHDLDLLRRLQVLSCVSGGSVIGAMYAYDQCRFEEFESKIIRLLESGLTPAIVRRSLLSPQLPLSLATSLASGVPALVTDAVRFLGNRLRGLFRREDLGQRSGFDRLYSPWRRWTSRSHALENVLRSYFPDGATLTSPTREGIDIVINATELRTGSAFRFGSKESGSWRTGTAVDNAIPLSLAVTASAAFPILLPALDLKCTLRRPNEKAQQRRVMLTDGGVYDNLGVSCMEPDRNEHYSTNCFSPSFLICCNAGSGPQLGEDVPYHWPSRMAASYQTTARKAQDATYSRLHGYLEDGKIDGFAMPYLGQDDSKIPFKPPDLVGRDLVMRYPTDFSPMSRRVIERIARRGEQLTRSLVVAYGSRL